MKLSLVAIQDLGFVYKENKGIDYSKYYGPKIKVLPTLEYVYILDNVSNLVIGSLMFKFLQSSGYVEYTECEGSIIRVTLNQKYFDDLENKQEI